MSDLDELATRAIAAPVSAPPPIEDLWTRNRQRRSRQVFVSLVVAAAVALGLTAILDRSHSAGVRVGTDPASTVPSPVGALRPVLDACTPTDAREEAVMGPRIVVPPRPTAVYADPERGIAGPLAVVVTFHGPGTAADGKAGGLLANTTVNGRDANLTELGGNWDLADGGAAVLYARGLDAETLRSLVEALDAGSAELPVGLQLIGTAERTEIGESTCRDTPGLAIREVSGSPASRFAQAFEVPTNAQRFDTPNGTTIFVYGANPTPDTAYHEATAEEWSRLLAAEPRAPSTETSAPSR